MWVLAALLATGCVSAPPSARKPVLRIDAPVALTPSAAGRGATWPTVDWWRTYGDPTLDALIDAAFKGSPDIAAADARFAAARHAVSLTRAALGLQAQASGDISRQRLSDNGLISPNALGFNWYNEADLGLQASYSFDWWGKQKAQIEAALDEARATEAEKAAAKLLLASAIAETYFGWQTDQQRLVYARERLAAMERLARVMTLRVEAQLDNADTLRMTQYALAAARENILSMEGSANLRRVSLAALVGSRNEGLPELVVRPLPTAAQGLPADLTLDLVSRRPDIVASRWRVDAASQGLAVARASWYPDVSLRALVGLSSIDLGKLLQINSSNPSIGAAIHLPLFDGGVRKARHGLRGAQLDAAIAAYDEAVIGAVREVSAAATLSATLAAQQVERHSQLTEQEALLGNARSRVTAGTGDIRPQLLAALQVNTTEDGLAQIKLAALSADIGLRRALGGGYHATAAVATETKP
jgi:multidrug efflux system outer membrane protein